MELKRIAAIVAKNLGLDDVYIKDQYSEEEQGLTDKRDDYGYVELDSSRGDTYSLSDASREFGCGAHSAVVNYKMIIDTCKIVGIRPIQIFAAIPTVELVSFENDAHKIWREETNTELSIVKNVSRIRFKVNEVIKSCSQIDTNVELC